MTNKALFEPYSLGSLMLRNRIVMAHLTRNRAGRAPSQAISPLSNTASAQIDAGRRVTKAVHTKGGRIFLQLWHVGRVSHVDVQEHGAAPVAPSAIRASTKAFVNNAFVVACRSPDPSEGRAYSVESKSSSLAFSIAANVRRPPSS